MSAQHAGNGSNGPKAPNNVESQQALKSWWSNFKKRPKKDQNPPPKEPVAPGIFGVPLQDSIRYANVAISLIDENGKSFIYGYVPIVVAKCGVFLKERATDIEGIFRLSGSAKRIRELQEQFDSPPRYGKGLDWSGYTVHDAANILRRYLLQLPQPIVPHDAYELFREPLRNHQAQAVGDMDGQAADTGDFDYDKAIVTYQKLIVDMPSLNRQLLLYILDLLSVFASKSDINRMTSANLSAIFQPGMLSHPKHDMSPQEYRLSQDVIMFLIDNQDHFLFGMSGTAADEQTVRDVQSGPPAVPATPNRAQQSPLGRSASNASAGGDSAKKLGVRRNVSVSSKNSSTAHTPNTPSSGQFAAAATSGVHRSNTVPSKRSPALSSRDRGMESPRTPVALSPAKLPETGPTSPPAPVESSTAAAPATPRTPQTEQVAAVAKTSIETPEKATAKVAGETPKEAEKNEPKEKTTVPDPVATTGPAVQQQPGEATPTKQPAPTSRNASGSFSKGGIDETPEKKLPNKLKKKRMPNSPQHSFHGSSNSLGNADELQKTTSVVGPIPRIGDGLEESMGDPINAHTLDGTRDSGSQNLKAISPAGSIHTKSSVTDASEQGDGSKADKKKKWRFSHKQKPGSSSGLAYETTHQDAAASANSVGSAPKSRTSVSNDQTAVTQEPTEAALKHQTSTSASTARNASHSKDTSISEEQPEKKNFFGRIKAKVEKSREERKAKEAEKERAKSPNRDNDPNKNSMSLAENPATEKMSSEATDNTQTASSAPEVAEKQAEQPKPSVEKTDFAETPAAEAKAEADTVQISNQPSNANEPAVADAAAETTKSDALPSETGNEKAKVETSDPSAESGLSPQASSQPDAANINITPATPTTS